MPKPTRNAVWIGAFGIHYGYGDDSVPYITITGGGEEPKLDITLNDRTLYDAETGPEFCADCERYTGGPEAHECNPSTSAIRALVESEKKAPATLREAAKMIINQIRAFDAECATGHYTDTGEAWDLFNWIRTRLIVSMANEDAKKDLEIGKPPPGTHTVSKGTFNKLVRQTIKVEEGGGQ